MLTFTLLLIVVYLFVRHTTWKAEAWPAQGVKPPMYQGHRGYWKGGAQENTLASFRAAKERGLAMVELDVHLSKDLIPVVFHDSDLKRLGHSDSHVGDLTAQELQQLVHAPTLEDLLKSTDVPSLFNIELKTDKAFSGILERAVADVVRKTQTEKRVLFSSFNPLAIRRLSKLLPEVPRALLASEEKGVDNRIYLRKLWFAPYIRANLLHLDYRYVDAAVIKRWAQRGVPVALWTVNDEIKAKELLAAGAISIISDTLH